MVSFNTKYSLDPGHVFEGKYRIVDELGSGGFGVVYLAQQLSMDRPVALKILKPGVGEHAPSARERFLREVKIISKLRHPNTVTIHDYGETIHGIVYMVLEYVEGETLKDLLNREGAQEPMRTLSVGRQIAKSLAEAHKHGIVHRDLKPANIMLTELEADSVFVKVLDFGVARLRDSGVDDLTSAGVPEGERALIGTPRYMSPEQVRGDDLTGASDVYGLGLIMYEMLVGEPAVQGDTTMGLISQQLSPEPLRLPSLHALIPPLQALLRRATEKSCQRRFASADEFARAIDETVLQLGEAVNAGDRAAYFALSGRFPAVSRNPSPATPSGGQRLSTSPGDIPLAQQAQQNQHQPHQHQPHQHQPHQQAQHPAAVAMPVGAGAAGSDGSMDWYEANFEPSQLDAAAAATPRAPMAAAAAAAPLAAQQFTGGSAPALGVDDDPLMNILDDELPPPPDEGASPFAEPEPTPPPVEDGPKELQEEADESLFLFAFTVLKICFLATLAAFFVYSSFLLMTALVGEYIDGFMRMGVGVAVALALPLLTALGEFSRKERFDVVQKPSPRITRIFIGVSILSAIVGVMVSFAMPGLVTHHLRNDANWMFQQSAGVVYDPTPTTNLNMQYSHFLADMVEKSTAAIGRYDGEPTTAQDDDQPPEDVPVVAPPPPEPTRPTTRGSTAPPPTRPGTQQRTDDQEAEQEADEETEQGADEAPAPRRSPPPTRPRQPSNDDDSDYVRW